jgi:glycosyltransferase involved in cell wall biosynthesis
MVEDGVTALVVRRGDHVAMAASAQRLLDDRRLAGELIEGARRSSREYGWEAARGRWLALYRELT